MSALEFVLALAAIGLSGAGLAAPAFATRPRSAGERALFATLAIALGVGAWSASFAAAIFALGSKWSVIATKDALLVAVGVALLTRARRAWPDLPASPQPTKPGTRGLVWLVLAATGLATALFLWKLAALPEGSWDACAIWNQRARFLLLGEGRAFERAFDPANAHADYPLLLPGCVAQGWALAGESAFVPAAVGALFLGLAVLGLALAVGRLRGRDAGLGAALALLGAPFFVALAAEELADVPLAAFVVLALGLVAFAFEEDERRRERLVLAGLAASLGAWTKNEGALFLVALGLALVLVRARPDEPRREALRRARDFALGSLPVVGLLVWFKLGYAPRNDLVEGLDQGVARATDLSRAGQVVRAAFGELWRVGDWGVALFAVPILAFVLRGEPARGPAVRMGACVLGLAALGFFVVYMVTPYDLAWHLDRSLDRLVAQLLPVGLLVAFLCLPRQAPALAAANP